MDQVLLNVAFGAMASTILASASVRSRSLSFSGGVGAIVIGTVIFGYGGLAWYVVLLAFFFSSSFLTRFRYSTKAAKGVSELKGGARTFWQAVGQGGVAALIAGFAFFSAADPVMLAVGFVGALAEANADTWAVEVGLLSKGGPRMITALSRSVRPGTSGGVSTLGEISAVAGSVSIALIGAVIGVFGSAPLIPLVVAGFAAIVGEHIDSILGATIQALYYCPNCKKETERRIHKCGTEAHRVRGLETVTNEAVNFFSTCFAAAFAVTLYSLV